VLTTATAFAAMAAAARPTALTVADRRVASTASTVTQARAVQAERSER